MNKFAESLYKLAEELYSKGMEDRYVVPTEDEEQDVDVGFSSKYKDYLNKITPAKANLSSGSKASKPSGKFFTAKPASTSVSNKDFQYKNFSKNTDFASVAPYIIQAESQGKYYQSLKPNSDNTVDYGFFQINDLNLDRKTSGGKLADAWDPIFKKYHDFYNKNLSGKTIDGIKYEPLSGDSLDVNTRKQLLKTKHKKFNSYGPSLS
tara:strand:+ start:321 stop:941 length:621 start_codon:yes stop_codon:yes gene_type:complete